MHNSDWSLFWRRARHRFTPQVVKDILASDRFQSRLKLWHLIHDLGSNTKARFETTKFLPYVVSAPTSKNLIGFSLCKPSTAPSHGGRVSLPPELPHFELPGL